MKYFEEAKNIWKTQVPSSGQAKTVQGELIRAVEKLRDEAQRNGNINWDQGFEILASFLIKTLTKDKSIDKNTRKEILQNIKIITDGRRPYLDDDIYNKLTDKIIEWSIRKGELVPHVSNPKLKR